MHLQFCVSSLQHPVCSSPLERSIQQSEPWTRFCTQRVAGKTRGMLRTHIRDLKQPRVPLKTRERQRCPCTCALYRHSYICQVVYSTNRTTCDFNKLNGTHNAPAHAVPQCQMGISLENCPKKSRWKEVLKCSTLPGTLPSTHQHWLGTPTKVLIALLSNWVIALQFTSNSHLVLPRLQSLFALHPLSKVLTQHLFSDFYVRN